MRKSIKPKRIATRHAASWIAAMSLSFAVLLPACAHDMHGMQHGMQNDSENAADAAPPVFIASTEKPFDALMGDAMAVMEAGMEKAPMNGMAEHDFVTMMIPHHQGAVDMAKAILLYSQDPEMRNLAQGIITEQQNEIRVMQLWLQHHSSNAATASGAR